MLTVCAWKWGDKYLASDVAKVAAGCRRHIKQPFRFLCITDDLENVPGGVEPWAIRDPELTRTKGCFARLRMFDPQWMAWHDVDRVVCLDLDIVITGPLDSLFDRPEPFLILQGANAANPCPYNGSMMLIRVGAHPQVWSEFSLEAANKIPYYEFPDDQAWIAHKVPKAVGWRAGTDGIYAFKKPGWPTGNDLPKDARIVVFPGWRSPEKFTHLPWVQQHWRE